MAKKLGPVLVSASCGMLLLLSALVPRGGSLPRLQRLRTRVRYCVRDSHVPGLLLQLQPQTERPRHKQLRFRNPGHGDLRRRVGKSGFDRQRHLRESRRSGRRGGRQRNSTRCLGALLDAARAAAAGWAILKKAV
ncbi:hypothetical protein MTO96_023836 [Rhipicephalus appendiculatus]